VNIHNIIDIFLLSYERLDGTCVKQQGLPRGIDRDFVNELIDRARAARQGIAQWPQYSTKNHDAQHP
jgi:hypothetical protein